ncbi:MAG: choice-of-anchor E domain-containing protein [Gloeobacteraceae cyanobacterium ES-bin-144]|nr:choice-of-anchor E domain-containing protein [Verrucomicrobiales bacterium]
MKTINTLILLTALGGSACATTITQTKTKAAYLAGNPEVLTFSKFDSSLGQLTGITVGFSFVKSGGSLAVDNDGTLGGSVLFRHDLESYLTSSTVNIGSSSVYNTALARSTASFTVGANDGDNTDTFDIGTSDHHVYNAVTKTTTFATENISSNFWGDYIGTGNYDIHFETIQSYSASGIGGLQTLGLAASVTPTVTVTYDYTPTAIPELASWMMICLGLGGALFIRRRSV